MLVWHGLVAAFPVQFWTLPPCDQLLLISTSPPFSNNVIRGFINFWPQGQKIVLGAKSCPSDQKLPQMPNVVIGTACSLVQLALQLNGQSASLERVGRSFSGALLKHACFRCFSFRYPRGPPFSKNVIRVLV
jgi:hypothetical protein